MSLVQSGTYETKNKKTNAHPDKDPKCIREGQGQVNASQQGVTFTRAVQSVTVLIATCIWRTHWLFISHKNFNSVWLYSPATRLNAVLQSCAAIVYKDHTEADGKIRLWRDSNYDFTYFKWLIKSQFSINMHIKWAVCSLIWTVTTCYISVINELKDFPPSLSCLWWDQSVVVVL